MDYKKSIKSLKIKKGYSWDDCVFSSLLIIFKNYYYEKGGVQNMEWPNVEQPGFQNFKITSIKVTNDQLFDLYSEKFIFAFFSNEILQF